MLTIRMLPAEDGDCLLIEAGDPGSPFRILVDGGRRSTLPMILELVADLPARASAPIDLLVLTHVDADHIEALLELAESATPFPIGELWFNGLVHHRIAAGEDHLERTWPPRERGPSETTNVLSARQALRFAGEIGGRNWPWNKAFAGGPAMTTTLALPVAPLPCGGRIVLLGPPQPKLAAFRKEIAAAFQQMGENGAAVLGRHAASQIGDVEALARQASNPDRTAPNGASIAFVIESGGKSALFCADAHPDDLAAALERYRPGAQRVFFDAIKVPHHGSARNNTPALIDRLESPLWLVSSDGSRSHHPDPQAIARIVLAGAPGKTLVFNYRSDFTDVWDRDMLKGRYAYATWFPCPGQAVSL